MWGIHNNLSQKVNALLKIPTIFADQSARNNALLLESNHLCFCLRSHLNGELNRNFVPISIKKETFEKIKKLEIQLGILNKEVQGRFEPEVQAIYQQNLGAAYQLSNFQQIMQRIREIHSRGLDWDSQQGKCLFFGAIHTGDLELVAAFMKEGANVNPEEIAGDYYRPLVAAVYSKKIAMVQFLLDQGADPTLKGFLTLRSGDALEWHDAPPSEFAECILLEAKQQVGGITLSEKQELEEMVQLLKEKK